MVWPAYPVRAGGAVGEDTIERGLVSQDPLGLLLDRGECCHDPFG